MTGIFYDSANLVDFRKWFATGILRGATTNPVILQKEGVFNIPEHIKKMIEICGEDFPISIEIPDSEMPEDEMIKLALGYSNMFPKNAVIKVPMDARNPQKSLRVIHKLYCINERFIPSNHPVENEIQINATLGITSGQIISAMEAGADYVSLFWGRCEEAGGIGAEETLKTIINYRENHPRTEHTKIIIGSIRTIDQIDKAFSLGADIVTIKPELLEKWMFTQRGVETVDEFNKAYRDVKDKMKLI